MPCRRASLFIGALLGNLEGVRLPRLLRDKKSVSGFRKGSGDGYLLPLGPHLGNLEEGSSTGYFERWMKKALWMKRLSLERLCGGGWGGEAPSLGTLEDMLRKSPDMGISLQGGPFPAEGNLVCGGGSYTKDF